MPTFRGHAGPVSYSQALRHYESVVRRVQKGASAFMVSRAERLTARAWALLDLPAEAVLEELVECRDEAALLEGTPRWLSGDAGVELVQATHFLRLALTEAVKEARLLIATEEELGGEWLEPEIQSQADLVAAADEDDEARPN